MSSKEKAIELVGKFKPYVDENNLIGDNPSEEWAFRNCKESALIAVYEILEATKLPNYLISTSYENGTGSGLRKINGYNYSSYWKEVENEIKKL